MQPQQVLIQAVEWVRREPGLALMTGAAAYLLLLLLVIFLLFFMIRLGRKQARLLRGTDGESLERMLLEQVDTAREVRDRISTTAKASSDNAEAIRLCMQKVGLVRYDAFADVGGEQSFSLALLDGGNNGLVVSGLYSRNDMRVYAKPVVSGGSPLSLTDEEQKAISSANAGGPITVQAGRGSGRGLAGGRR